MSNGTETESRAFMEAIPLPIFKNGMTPLPPIYSLNRSFNDLVEAVNRVQAIDIPVPTGRDQILERLSREVEIDSKTLEAMNTMNSITEILNHMANEAEGTVKQV